MTFCKVELISPIRLLKRAAVALTPITRGIASDNPKSGAPFKNLCMIVVALPASVPCIPRCASSIIKYSLSDFCLAVFSIVSQIVYWRLSECLQRFAVFVIFCVFIK